MVTSVPRDGIGVAGTLMAAKRPVARTAARGLRAESGGVEGRGYVAGHEGSHGIRLERRITAEAPVRVDYELTALGHSLLPVMRAI
ncbi:winged helix-turn-helix transcriptional regulator [Nocardia sp. CA-107356]|uniref:winged helix-turn-helix transcriptional regulator n=1 Tax=Nocardia sp. CA-107356 TaxID=3239972 RepID=UPI003D93471E